MSDFFSSFAVYCILILLAIPMHNCRFFFDFSATYIGAGMICPYIVNISVLVGGILSWGIMWPLIQNKKGDWYSAELPDSSFHGFQGYKVTEFVPFAYC